MLILLETLALLPEYVLKAKKNFLILCSKAHWRNKPRTKVKETATDQRRCETFYRKHFLSLIQTDNQPIALFRKYIAIEEEHLTTRSVKFEIVQDRLEFRFRFGAWPFESKVLIPKN